MSDNVIVLGTVGSLFAGLGTTVGALGVLFVRKLSTRAEDVLLSSAAGVMLAATFFSLLLPGLEYGTDSLGSATWAALVVIGGLLAGGIVLEVIHRSVPHEHFVAGREGPEAAHVKRLWLFVIAITLHNLPEGMAVGVGFAEGNVENGVALAAGIATQNLPEGLAVAASLLAMGYGRGTAIAVASLTGLVEPLGGLVGSAAAAAANMMLPFILGAAGGAMLFIISDEIIPETHRRGNETAATFALMGGFALMILLDAVLA